jgi:hypothetical protein
MESEIERLRAMLDGQEVWEKPAESESTLDVNLDAKCTPGIDEGFPSYRQRLEDELKQCVGPVEGRMTRHFIIMTFY